MKTIIRTIREEEIPKIAQFFGASKWNLSTKKDDLERLLTTQFHRQESLLNAIFEKESGVVLGAIMATGKGDTVWITNLWAKEEGFYELVKKLVMVEEKVCRHYGYSQIFLAALVAQKNFLITLGYKPRLLFTFSTHRKELFNLFSELYPLWIEAGGQEVKVLLGGDHLDESIKSELRNYPLKTDYLFLKYL